MKKVIYKQKQELTEIINLEITEKLYYKILKDMNCDPVVSFEDFYDCAIGNEHYYPYVDYDYYLKEGYSYHGVDYYDNEPYSGYVEAGIKRRHNSLDVAIHEYFDTHPEVLPKPVRDLKEHTWREILVPDRKIRYE